MLNMTLEEAKLYHYRLWDRIVKILPHNVDTGGLYLIKSHAFHELRFRGLVPNEPPVNCCYLCEYYANCRVCPLDGCNLYYMIMEALEQKDVDKAVSLAKSIRDIYETDNNKNKDEK